MNYIDKEPVPFGVSPGRTSRETGRDFEEEDGLNLLEYWRLLRKHWLSILLLGIAGFVLAHWYARTIVPIYSSGVTVVIDNSRGAATGVVDDYSYYYAAQMFYNTQQTVLSSRELSERAARRLDPAERERLLRRPEPGAVDKIIANVWGRLKTTFGNGEDDNPTVAKPTPSSETSPEPLGANGEWTRYGGIIQGGKRISPSRDSSQIVTIRFSSHDPEMAARVANALADAYIEYTAETRETISEQSGRWLAQQVERMREKLTESQNALQEFQVREGLLNLEDVKSLASARLQALNEKVTDAKRNYDELSKRYGPKHPQLIRARTELDAAREQLSQESKSIVLDTEKRYQLAKLENDVQSNQEVYELYLSRFKKMDVTTNETISPVYVLDRAQVPGGPVKPDKQRIGMIGLFGGLFLGALLAWVREKLDNTYHTPVQIEQEFGVPNLGTVPFLGREDSRMGRRMSRRSHKSSKFSLERFYSHYGKSPYAESINHIRTGIIYSRAENTPKTILITSAVQSEGKTTLAINLALALAQVGSTLLIDADLRKPRVHQVTREKSNAGGLVELMVGRAEAKDVLIKDEDSSRLTFLKSGVIPPNPQELLSSRKFDELLHEFEKQYDYILIDCAPVVPVSDALVLARKVDALMLVIRADSTPTEMVRDAVKRIESVNAPLVGTVLSHFDHRRHSHFGRYAYYSKYYSYAYGKKS